MSRHPTKAIPGEHAHKRPWERRQDEHDRAWEVVALYRDMGSGIGSATGHRIVGVRTMDKLYEVVKDLYDTPPAASSLRAWSRKFEWRRRCRLYDAHLDRMALATTEKTLREAQRRHVRLAMDMQAAVSPELAKLVREAQASSGRLEGVSIAELVRLAEVGVKLERLSRGQTTESVEGRLDLSKLSLDELKALKKLKNKATTDR